MSWGGRVWVSEQNGTSQGNSGGKAFRKLVLYEREPSIIKLFLAEAAIELGSAPEMARE